MRTERLEGPMPAGGTSAEAHYDNTGRVVEIHEFDEAGNSIARTHAPPPDPHVESLVYRFVPTKGDDFSASFEGATPVEYETAAFVGASAYYNFKPVEQDANAAASVYLRSRYPEQVEPMLHDPEGSGLVRSQQPPEGSSTLVGRTVAFLYQFAGPFSAERPSRVRQPSTSSVSRRRADPQPQHGGRSKPSIARTQGATMGQQDRPRRPEATARALARESAPERGFLRLTETRRGPRTLLRICARWFDSSRGH